MKKEKIKLIIIVLMVLLLAGSVGATVYFYKKYADAKNNPNKTSNDEVTVLVSKISKNMNLPDEVPTVATVSDVEKLKDQAFFKNVQNGDKLLIYINAKKAVVYRPSNQKIVEFGLVVNDASAVTPTPMENAPTAAPLSVVIYNGTEEKEKSDEVEQKMVGLKDLMVTKKSKAAKTDYPQTMVVDVNGKNQTRVTEIATAVGGIVSSLPKGEEKPDADILIIAGK